MTTPKLGVEISDRAERELANLLDWLRARNQSAAQEAERDIANAVDMAARRPRANRPVRTPGGVDTRIKSLPKWHKVIIYRVESDRIIIVAIRDTRQEPKEP